MAKILDKAVSGAKSAWKQGLSTGARTGVLQGGIGMLGVHPFFSRLAGGVISASFEKDEVLKKVTLAESSKEAIYQLMAGE